MANTTKAVNSLDRALKALELRKKGHTYDEIARQLGYANKDGAYRSVKSALDKTLRESADDLRTIEAERLDTLMQPFYRRACRGDNLALDRLLKLMERRAKLLGIDREKAGPTQVNISADVVGAAEQRRAERLARLAGQAGPEQLPAPDPEPLDTPEPE